VTTCQEKVKQTEKEYREKLECANAIQDKLHKDQMPKVLDVLSFYLILLFFESENIFMKGKKKKKNRN